MSKVSVIIPSRNERFMPQTVDDLFAKASGEIEVIVVLDGYWPTVWPKENDKIIYLHRTVPLGMRAAINGGAAIATGKYLMKTDGHCMFESGFDETLKKDCDEDWVCIPRRYSLNAEEWCRNPKEPIDYHYLDCPMTNPEYFQFHGVVWLERGRERRDIPIDDLLSWQGSMWFMDARHFHKRLGGLSEHGYGTFSQEPQEIGMKTWLGGGRMIINKNTWYAHLHKGKQYGRGYHQNREEVKLGHKYSAWHWMTNQWTERKHDMKWLIDKFWPLPRWPDNWEELLAKYPRET
jgi:glycosyltransferase involved in cell wall biosynthesis